MKVGDEVGLVYENKRYEGLITNPAGGDPRNPMWEVRFEETPEMFVRVFRSSHQLRFIRAGVSIPTPPEEVPTFPAKVLEVITYKHINGTIITEVRFEITEGPWKGMELVGSR